MLLYALLFKKIYIVVKIIIIFFARIHSHVEPTFLIPSMGWNKFCPLKVGQKLSSIEKVG